MTEWRGKSTDLFCRKFSAFRDRNVVRALFKYQPKALGLTCRRNRGVYSRGCILTGIFLVHPWESPGLNSVCFLGLEWSTLKVHAWVDFNGDINCSIRLAFQGSSHFRMRWVICACSACMWILAQARYRKIFYWNKHRKMNIFSAFTFWFLPQGKM